jgi:predicted nucleic acid-binding protein
VQISGQKHSQAKEFMRDLWQSGEGCLNIQVLLEFYVNVIEKVAKPLPAEAAAQTTADLSVWEVHCPGMEDVLDAIHLQKRYQISLWDAMILASARQLGCQVIWSEDLNPDQVYDQAEA